MNQGQATPLLEAYDLEKRFPLPGAGWLGGKARQVQALRGVSLTLRQGETLALVGESGCGKTTLAKTLALLLAPDGGSIRFAGQAVSSGSGRRALAPFRRRIQMIFQDPYGSLNPRLTAGEIIAEPLIIHRLGNAARRRQRVAEAAAAVGMESADLGRYPHQFSGGQRQRIAIARAIVAEPSLIIADEPLSALDMSVQSQVINLLADLGAARRLTYLFITHDLGVVHYLADRVAVMYLGRIVELAPTQALFAAPRHPYSRALIHAQPRPGRGKRRPGSSLKGDVASPIEPPPGCAFHPRCPLTAAICRESTPRLEARSGDGASHSESHWAACHFADPS